MAEFDAHNPLHRAQLLKITQSITPNLAGRAFKLDGLESMTYIEAVRKLCEFIDDIFA